MAVIENFAELSFEEQKEFAEALVKTINSESTFIDYTNFKVSGVEVDELSGDLVVSIEHDDLIEVDREASWQCADVEDAVNDPGYDAEYTNYLFEDLKKAFKTLDAVIEGYKVSLSIDDADVEETIDVDVAKYSHEDAGIGSYEYWGHSGYDSRPYVEVEGTISVACSCALSLFVEPAETVAEEPAVEEA